MAYTEKQGVRGAAALMAALVLGFAFLLHGGAHGDFALRVIDDVGQAGASLLAGTLCAWRAHRSAGRSRSSWALITAGLLAWSIGEAVWSWYELIERQEVPFPSPADLGFLLFPVLALAGLLVGPAAAFAGRGRVRVVLDATMVAASLFVLSWLTTLGSVYDAGASSTVAFLVSIAYPIGDLVLLCVAFLVIMHGRIRADLVVFCVGLVFMAVADSGFTYLTAAGTYRTGSLVDIAWFAGFLIMGFSGLIERHDDVAGEQRIEAPLTLALPYVMVLFAAVLQVFDAVDGGIDPIALLVTIAAVAALLVRQFLVVLDNRRLTADILAQREELSFRAFHDALTGLANRALFYDRVAHAVDLHHRDLRPITVIFVDLDDFKTINDAHGHDVGDTVLSAVAQRLSGVIRTGDTIARLGGDEFAILVEDDGDVHALGARLMDSMCLPIVVDTTHLPVSASVGIATLDPSHGSTDIQELLKQADVAMYAAKRAGKGRSVHFTPDLRDTGRDAMESALIEYVHSGAVDTVYQPVVRLEDDSLFAVEALARWHYRGDAVPPEVFIPMAERLGVLGDLDIAMVRRSLARAACAPDRLDRVMVSANLALARFRDHAICDRLAAALAEFGIRPDRLVVEITEREMAVSGATDGALAALRELGVSVAIDDFGIGYSNLSRLDALRPDIVKLDKTFVDALCERAASRKLLAGVIDLAHELGALVIGEGVEHLDQLTVLRDLGCDAVQGLIIGRAAGWTDGDPVGPPFGDSRQRLAVAPQSRAPLDAAC